jgi:hypothetical protein
MVPLVFMESQGFDQCLAMSTHTRDSAAAAKPLIHGLEYAAEPYGCAKRIGYEEGIPIHKIRSFHFWTGKRHVLPGTLPQRSYN